MNIRLFAKDAGRKFLMIIDCISDLHGHHPELEGGDLLIVAGDLTASDKAYQYFEFREWLLKQQYNIKIFISGNHDCLIEMGRFYFSNEWIGADYLCDSGTEFEGLKIWGSPWTKTFKGMNPHCKAFTCDTEEQLAEKWKLIPDDIDILVTHSPPYGILDGIPNMYDGTYFHAGSKSLDKRIFYSTSLQLHVFGHIHENGGKIIERTQNVCDKHMSVNASYVNEHYKPVNKPIRVIL